MQAEKSTPAKLERNSTATGRNLLVAFAFGLREERIHSESTDRSNPEEYSQGLI